MPPELFLVPPVVILVIIALTGLARRKALLRQWQSIAERTGLKLRTEPIMIVLAVEGSHRGRELVMAPSAGPSVDRDISGPRSGTMVTVQLANAGDLQLRMLPQDLLDKLLSLPDVQVGDEALDRRFLIQSNEPARAQEVLADAAVRQALLAADVCDVYLSRSKLQVYYDRVERDAAHAVRLLDAACLLADAIDHVRPGVRSRG